MPQIETWSRLPRAIRDHLVDRMRERKISLDDLNQLRIWIESQPDVPEGAWYKDFRIIYLTQVMLTGMIFRHGSNPQSLRGFGGFAALTARFISRFTLLISFLSGTR